MCLWCFLSCSVTVGAVLSKREKVILPRFLPVCVWVCVCGVHVLICSPCNSLHAKWMEMFYLFIFFRHFVEMMTISLTSILFMSPLYRNKASVWNHTCVRCHCAQKTTQCSRACRPFSAELRSQRCGRATESHGLPSFHLFRNMDSADHMYRRICNVRVLCSIDFSQSTWGEIGRLK